MHSRVRGGGDKEMSNYVVMIDAGSKKEPIEKIKNVMLLWDIKLHEL